MGSHGQKWLRPFRSWDSKIRCNFSNDLMNWVDWLNNIYMLIVMEKCLVKSLINSVFLTFNLGVHCSCTYLEYFASSALRKKIINWFSEMSLVKAWLSVKIGNDQKPRYSSCMVMVIEFRRFIYLSTLTHCYHTPLVQSIAIPAMAFSLHKFKILSILHHGILSDRYPLNFYLFIYSFDYLF